MPIQFTVLGSPQSKSNSRRLVSFGGRPRLIKSAAALSYSQVFLLQCPQLSSPLEGDLRFTATIYYSSRRPDLDESLLMDLMQGRIYKNDRQIKEKHIFHGLDPANPRAVIQLETL